MSIKISTSGPVTDHYLVVHSDGVEFFHASNSDRTRHFRFTDIDCILMSPDNRLSLQVNEEVFSIPTDPNNHKHQTVIATLLWEVKRAGAGWADSTDG